MHFLDVIMVKVLEEASKEQVPGVGENTKAEEEESGANSGSKKELTSLDIREAIKRVVGERFRPYLPSTTKLAWSLDKQSIKGIKRKRKVYGTKNKR